MHGNLKKLNCSEENLITYLTWLYKKAQKQTCFVSLKKNSRKYEDEIYLDKVSSKICWLYVSSNKKFTELITKYNRTRNENIREHLATSIYFKYGIKDVTTAHGFDFKDFVRRPRPIRAVNSKDIKETKPSPLQIMEQLSKIEGSNTLFLSINTDHAYKFILEEFTTTLQRHMNLNKRGEVGYKSINTDNLFKQIISYYFNYKSTDEVNLLFEDIMGTHEDIDFNDKQLKSHAEQFEEVAKEAPFIFFRYKK